MLERKLLGGGGGAGQEFELETQSEEQESHVEPLHKPDEGQYSQAAVYHPLVSESATHAVQWLLWLHDCACTMVATWVAKSAQRLARSIMAVWPQ